MKIFKFSKKSENCYLVHVSNSDKLIGGLLRDVDGYYYFFLQDYNGGSFNANFMREIADKLDELNKEMDNLINEYFNNL